MKIINELIYRNHRKGGDSLKLVCNVGGMFSGKTTELLRQGRRHVLAGHNVVYLKPKFDDRYAENEVVTHLGDSVQAINVTDTLLCDEVLASDVILVDEAQFLPYCLITDFRLLLMKGKTIYVSALDMDAKGNGYLLVEGLMSLADYVNKFKAVCECCGSDATYTGKRVKNDVRDELGSKDLYIPLCRKCYYKTNLW